jgi:hypothetical protein
VAVQCIRSGQSDRFFLPNRESISLVRLSEEVVATITSSG